MTTTYEIVWIFSLMIWVFFSFWILAFLRGGSDDE